jgi:hypothetical protein
MTMPVKQMRFAVFDWPLLIRSPDPHQVLFRIPPTWVAVVGARVDPVEAHVRKANALCCFRLAASHSLF